MKTYKDFIIKIEGNLITEKSGIYKNILSFLVRNYKEIKKEIEIIDYNVKKNSHYLELKIENSFFFEINITKESIHVIINEFEQMFFFDNENFISLYKEILNSIFEGDYKILKYKKANSIFSELKFHSPSLKFYNNNKITLVNKDYTIIKKTEGVRLIKTASRSE